MNEEGFELTIGGESHLATPRTISLFNFAGELACYDHIFLVTGQEDDDTLGTYIFNDIEGYQVLRNYLIENRYPLHTNLYEVPDCDKDAWTRHIMQDLLEQPSYPEAWDAAES